MQHLLKITDLNHHQMTALFDRTEHFLQTLVKNNQQSTALAGQVVANLFFEPSTRTQFSFTIAAHRLGALALNPLMNRTSTVKGESLLDTVRTFIAMGAKLIVVRHSEEHVPELLAKEIGQEACIINGGDGAHQHPSQALLDLFTIHKYKGEFRGLKVAIMGDIAHSRVARSLVQGLKIMGCTDINVIAPTQFMPQDLETWGVHSYHDIAEGISGADVIVTLRIQLERIVLTSHMPEPKMFFEKYRLNAENLRLANPKAIVMHPAPMNRELEITSEVADGPQSVIFQQITHGVAVRMAVIESLCFTNYRLNT